MRDFIDSVEDKDFREIKEKSNGFIDAESDNNVPTVDNIYTIF